MTTKIMIKQALVERRKTQAVMEAAWEAYRKYPTSENLQTWRNSKHVWYQAWKAHRTLIAA
jgi:hypothetical protein